MLKALVVMLLLNPVTALACSCASLAKTLQEEIGSYDAIFLGTSVGLIESATLSPDAMYKTGITVEKIWKGDKVKNFVVISTKTEINSCGAPPPPRGNDFLIFAHNYEDGSFLTGGCSTFVDLTALDTELRAATPDERDFWRDTYSELWSALGNPNVVFRK